MKLINLVLVTIVVGLPQAWSSNWRFEQGIPGDHVVKVKDFIFDRMDGGYPAPRPSFIAGKVGLPKEEVVVISAGLQVQTHMDANKIIKKTSDKN